MKRKILESTSNPNKIIKFGTQSLVENGLVLKNNRKEEQPILFSEVNKVYIKKRKLSGLSKIGYLLLFVMLLAISSIFLPIEFVMLSSILCIPLIAKMNTYKWYELHLLINDGNLYSKNFYLSTKQEHINFVNQVRNQLFECQIKSNLQYQNAYFEEEISNNYSHSNLSIA